MASAYLLAQVACPPGLPRSRAGKAYQAGEGNFCQHRIIDAEGRMIGRLI